MYGTPEEGRAVLQAAGINHFLFSRELAKKVRVHDLLPLSPLFSPDNIARYLGVRWSDRNTVLLTWSGPQTRPLDGALVEDYRRAARSSAPAISFPADAVREIYERLRATPHPWGSLPLPCQQYRPPAMC
jgi:hypothetical protein